MNNRSLLKMLLGGFLLVLLLAAQVLTTPIPGRKAKKGDCDDSCNLHEPQGAQQPQPAIIETESQPQTHLEQLWNSINTKVVNVNNILQWKLDVQKPAVYGATEIYGCTVVVVVDAKSLVIGHFAEERGNGFTLESLSETKKFIIEPLEEELVLRDWTDQAVAYIVHSSRSAVPGLAAIKETFMNSGVSEANIKESVYTRLRPTVGSRGKVVVTWEPLDEGGAELQLYIQNDNPVYVRQFDENANPCALIR